MDHSPQCPFTLLHSCGKLEAPAQTPNTAAQGVYTFGSLKPCIHSRGHSGTQVPPDHICLVEAGLAGGHGEPSLGSCPSPARSALGSGKDVETRRQEQEGTFFPPAGGRWARLLQAAYLEEVCREGLEFFTTGTFPRVCVCACVCTLLSGEDAEGRRKVMSSSMRQRSFPGKWKSPRHGWRAWGQSDFILWLCVTQLLLLLNCYNLSCRC